MSVTNRSLQGRNRRPKPHLLGLGGGTPNLYIASPSFQDVNVAGNLTVAGTSNIQSLACTSVTVTQGVVADSIGANLVNVNGLVECDEIRSVNSLIINVTANEVACQRISQSLFFGRNTLNSTDVLGDLIADSIEADTIAANAAGFLVANIPTLAATTFSSASSNVGVCTASEYKIGNTGLLSVQEVSGVSFNMNGTYQSTTLTVKNRARYLVIAAVSISATSNNSAWRFQMSLRYGQTGVLPPPTKTISPGLLSSTLRYGNDNMTINWSDYLDVNIDDSTSNLISLGVTSYNTATPSTAKSGSMSIRVIYLGAT